MLDARARRALAMMEIPVWQGRARPPAADVWTELAAQVKECRLCALHETRSQTVFGTGAKDARWFFVGEAPGADEDRLGEPFVGRAGQLLNAMLRALSLVREDVYIANVLKCRPPRNRDPEPAEVQQCLPYLQKQIALVGPAVLVALGRIAAQSLLATSAPLGSLREKVHHYAGVPLIVTYHPAYLLRSPADKQHAWADLKRAQALVNHE